MNINELIELTVDKVLSGETEMFVVLKTQYGEKEYRRLVGKNSPLGKIVSQEGKGTVCVFDPMDILCFLLANMAIDIEVSEGRA